MAETSQPGFTPQEVDQLQQVRLAVAAFQNTIASLPADEQNNGRNEQFNQLRLEAKAVLKEHNFDQKVPKAVTEEVLAERSQRVILPRLSGIVIFGVILALLGLGINSIILDDLIINSLACLVSSGGMALVFGAFVVWAITTSRRRLSNLGDLYLRGNALLYEIDHTLNQALPGWAERPAVAVPEIPSVVALALDSLHKQATDWQQKLRDLEEQRLTLGHNAPLELKLNLDFVQQELQRVRLEINRLQGQTAVDEAGPRGAKVIIPLGAKEVAGDSTSVRRAKSVTMDMPVQPPEEGTGSAEETTLTLEENPD
ncbi:MAG: hypothetical protein HYR94_19640 [Chloroflexi bacterium]|nr:hypothetical protein [Chloroflexota bacterium]